jgi:hypothetical protein
LTLLSGCALLLPRTAALKSVHQTYREEFAHWVVPAPGEQKPPSAADQPPFVATLQAIRDFRVKYGGDSAEESHLTVLEGMIYLQTGRIGMARLMAPEVRKQIPHLQSGSGLDVRDELFAENFDDLVQGWGEINDKFDNDPSTFTEWAKLSGAARSINERLSQKLQARRLAATDADEGAVYLATTAGIFYDWAYATEKIENEGAANTNKLAWFSESHDLIGKFLSDTEKKAAADTNAPASTTSPGRVRYVEWYGWLGRQLN